GRPEHRHCRDLAASQFNSKRGQPLGLIVAPTVFDRYILALGEPGFFQALAECTHPVRVAVGRCWMQKADHRHRSLRARRHRPYCCAAKPRDEVPPFHSITSSARARSGAGTVMPSALAVLILMTSWKRVGCSTGKSAGWAPLRILSTYTAALRKRSAYIAEYDISPPSSTNQRGTETAGAAINLYHEAPTRTVGDLEDLIWSSACATAAVCADAGALASAVVR